MQVKSGGSDENERFIPNPHVIYSPTDEPAILAVTQWFPNINELQ
jgi:hypothetical protein